MSVDTGARERLAAQLLANADADPVRFLIALGESERCPFPCAKCAVEYLDAKERKDA